MRRLLLSLLLIPSLVLGASYSQINSLIRGDYGERGEIGIFGEQNVSELRDHISHHFGYGISETFDFTVAETGDGAVTVADRNVVLTGNTGSAAVTTKRGLLYKPGHTVIVGGTASFSGTGKGCFGLYNDNDGMRFCVTNGVPSAVREFDGTETEITSLNGESLSGIDFTKLNIYRIKYGYYGVALIVFEVLEPGSTNWLPIHIAYTHGTTTTAHSFPNLPVRFEAGAGAVVTSASFQAGTLGGSPDVGYRQFVISEDVNVGDTDTETQIGIFRSASTFHGEVNGILSRMLYTAHSTDLEGRLVLRIYRNPTVTTDTGWVFHDTGTGTDGDSVIQTSATAVATPGTGQLVYAETLAAGNLGIGATATESAMLDMHMDFWGGDYILVTAERDSGTTNYSVRTTWGWREFH